MDSLREAGQVLDDAVAVDRRNYDPGYIVLGELSLDAFKTSLAVLAWNESQLGAVVT